MDMNAETKTNGHTDKLLRLERIVNPVPPVKEIPPHLPAETLAANNEELPFAT